MKRPYLVATGLLSCLLATVASASAQSAGFALRFDGSTDQGRLHLTASMLAPTWPTTKSVSIWLNPTSLPAPCTSPHPASCDLVVGDSPRTWGISRGTLNGQDRLWLWNHDGTTDRVGVEYVPGEWIHVALVHEAGTLKAYKNGVLAGSVASGATVTGTGQRLHFGGLIGSATRNWTFEGEIDELQFWNIALGASEIAALLSGPLTGNESGLAAYYRMTDGIGLSLTDDTGHGWTGSLLDGAVGVPGNGPVAWVPSEAFGGGPPVPNTPPVAHAQQLTTVEDTSLPLTLTGFDADGHALRFRVTVLPAHGVLSGTAPALSYVPAANFNGPDSFAFVVNDGFVDSAPATVAIGVASVNDPPVAAADTAVTSLETAVEIPVLGNDSDVDGDIIGITAVDPPQHGSAAINLQQIVYVPVAGFSGTDTFSYTIADGQGGFASASVAVTVTAGGAAAGFALRFDGVSDHALLPKTVHMLAPGWESNKTVTLWVKPEGTPYCSFPEPASCDVIFGDRPRWWGISRGVVNGLDRIWVWNMDGSIRAVPIPYTAGQWMHIALVHGNGVLSAYRNGVLVGWIASGATRQPNLPGAEPSLSLGGIINSGTKNWSFKGEIDEVQIWNGARSPLQIAQDMSQPLTGAELGLAAYYRMTDGAGTRLTDDSGHGWTGILADGASGVPADGPILWVPSGAFSVLPPP